MTKNSNQTAPEILVKTQLLGLQMVNATANQVLEYIVNFLKNPSNSKQKLLIFTPNPEMIVYAHRHPETKKILNHAQINLPDGVGLTMAASILGQPLKQRIAGVDFMEKLCQECNEKPIKIGLLGAGPGVAEKTSKCLRIKFPKLQIVFAQAEWPSTPQALPEIDILFVAFGFPKQEEWIVKNIPNLPVKAAMAVGGSFDYISGKVSRAPYFMRMLGLEWLYRLIRQPWRWKRQLALIEFILLVVQERFKTIGL